MDDARTIIKELRAPTATLRNAIPDVWEGFGLLHDAAMADGAIQGKDKQFDRTGHLGGQALRRLHRVPRPRPAARLGAPLRRWARRWVSRS